MYEQRKWCNLIGDGCRRQTKIKSENRVREMGVETTWKQMHYWSISNVRRELVQYETTSEYLTEARLFFDVDIRSCLSRRLPSIGHPTVLVLVPYPPYLIGLGISCHVRRPWHSPIPFAYRDRNPTKASRMTCT